LKGSLCAQFYNEDTEEIPKVGGDDRVRRVAISAYWGVCLQYEALATRGSCRCENLMNGIDSSGNLYSGDTQLEPRTD
jgi:hypothetical protein